MKKAILILFLFSCFSPVLMAQKKELTIQDAIIGQWKNLYPEYIKQLRWQGKTNFYTYVKNSNLIKANLSSSKTDTLVYLKDINGVLHSNSIDSIKYFPAYKWKNKNSLEFSYKNHSLIYNITSKKFDLNITYDEKAENIDICHENYKMAYTIDNNLYITDKTSKITAVTNDEDKDFVNGQIASRNEFGIYKGTFWSPKGSYLVFYRKDNHDVKSFPLVDITKRIAEVEYIKYPMAGMKSEHVSLGVYNIATGKTIFIEGKDKTSEKYLTNISWGPNEKYIYIAVLNREQNHMKLNKYDVATGKIIKTLFEEKSDKYVEPEHTLTFLKTKPNQFLYQTRKDGYNHIYIYNTEGKLIKQLTKGNYEVTDVLGFNLKETNLFYVSTQESPIERHVYKINIKSGKITKLTKEAGTHRCILNKNREYLFDTYSNTEVPRVYNIISSKGEKVKNLLTSANPLKDYTLGEMKIGTIKAADGKTDLYYRLIKPVNFDPNKKYPAIIYVYGGPHAQLVNNSWLGAARMWQYYMAQKGYVMLTIDNRGSANRGLEFENAIFRNCGVNEMADQMKGVDLFKSLGYVDMNRIGVHGWSYGGFLSTSLIINHPDVFKVAVAGGPVIDWKFYEVMYGERYMDTPQENPEGYKNSSLLYRAKELKGKLLIIQGAIDKTVVWQNSLSFIRECVKNNVPVDYFAYPRAEHNVRGYDRIHLKDKVSHYFDDYLK
ncbi:MAG: DPP IV N-terminal domain-containing protein [Bacteroidales bacterium]|nr:DPP IV N-terminal domain-containing protein [Bacteroidales bacterium]